MSSSCFDCCGSDITEMASGMGGTLMKRNASGPFVPLRNIDDL